MITLATPYQQLMLRTAWCEAYAWMAAANGFNPSYDSMVATVFARDRASASLDQYFEMIERLISKWPELA